MVHALGQALAAAAAAEALGVPLVLRSAEGAGGYAGVGWFAGLARAVAEHHPALRVRYVLDCADEAGTAQAALGRGLADLRFGGSSEAALRLEAIGARLDRDERPALDLLGVADPESAVRAWLAPDR